MQVLTNILSTARLTRASIALGAVADVWLVVLLSRTLEMPNGGAENALPLWIALVASALTAVGFFSFGGVLNDLVDVKRDRALSPERPIPAGQIPPRNAVLLASVCLLCGVLGALPFGELAAALALLLALSILLYDAAAKYIPAARIVLFGVLSGMSMLVPNGHFPFALIIAMAMLQSIATATASYMVEGKRPLLSRRSTGILIVGILAAISGAFVVAEATNTSPPLLPSNMDWKSLLIPASIFTLGCVYLHFAARAKCKGDEPRHRGDRILRRGALWRAMTAAAWLLAAGLMLEAILLAATAALGFSAMAILRSCTPSPDGPPKWR
ncbi:MAG: hypothetical protein EXS10_10015 [Phycisphaerales bacterium]|nr:hypothetical protein [Phycisphaerales bacterium]